MRHAILITSFTLGFLGVASIVQSHETATPVSFSEKVSHWGYMFFDTSENTTKNYIGEGGFETEAA